MKYAFMYDNAIDGDIPEQFLQNSMVEKLSLRGNQLSGTLPNLFNETNLTFFDVSENKIGHLASNAFTDDKPDMKSLDVRLASFSRRALASYPARGRCALPYARS